MQRVDPYIRHLLATDPLQILQHQKIQIWDEGRLRRTTKGNEGERGWHDAVVEGYQMSVYDSIGNGRYTVRYCGDKEGEIDQISTPRLMLCYRLRE